jgi:hypothetical protein
MYKKAIRGISVVNIEACRKKQKKKSRLIKSPFTHPIEG